ncbi:MAG: efflux RND transporter periplasmic adaptor subunit [Deltaproteobacteria bacterium]|nr:efflux RND transporter periplasmic adaptor subunit [Deltaproteobacteria bacterium]
MFVVLGCFALLFVSHAGVCGQEGRTYDGLIEPSEIVKLSSPVQGTVETMAVERGDRVRKGQVIARLNSAVEKSAVELAQARVEFAKRKVLRNEDLYQKELISIHEKDEMETELKVAELQLREAKERLDLRVIRSTVNGVVVERFLSPGDYVGEYPILKIACIHPLNVELVVPAQDYGSIRRGMLAEVRPELGVSGKFSARVVIVDTVIDAASGTFGVRLEMPNPDFRLPAGLKCKVIFPPGQKKP